MARKSNTTRHSDTCCMAFGRKDPSCPRCQELLAGAAPVVWSSTIRKLEEQKTIAAIRAHNFTKCAKCNVCCTCFDY